LTLNDFNNTKITESIVVCHSLEKGNPWPGITLDPQSLHRRARQAEDDNVLLFQLIR